MSANRPQTASFVFAILTLFSTVAWGQQKGTDVPVYESAGAIFGADSISTELFPKTPLKTDGESPTNGLDEIDSLFGSSNKPMVDKNGYFIPAAHGGIWKDVAAEPVRPTRWTRHLTPTALATKKKQATERDTVLGPVVEIPSTVEPQAQNINFDNAGPSKFRLRLGFDVLAFERGRGEDTIFATDDDGNDWAFSDFDFTERDVRYIIQFMGDDQTGLELTFFDISFDSSIEASGDNVTPFFFQGLPATRSTSYDLNYRSRLKNIEINSWVRHNERQRSGYGVRHINLDETFDVLPGRNTGLFSRTENDLWGLTRMWERRRPVLNRLTLVGGADAGLYLNSASIDIDTANIDDNSEADNLAGTLGFNLGLEYLVADHVTLRVGYEGLAIFGAALGSTQSLEQNIFDGLDDPELGSIYFGGFHFGATASF